MHARETRPARYPTVGSCSRRASVSHGQWVNLCAVEASEVIMDQSPNESEAAPCLFRVKARITLVDGGYMDVPFNAYLADPDDVRRQVTKDYIITNVSD